MIEIKVCVTSAEEKERAECVRDHFESFAYALNGCYLTIFEGESRDIDAPANLENEPVITQIWNTIFNTNDE